MVTHSVLPWTTQPQDLPWCGARFSLLKFIIALMALMLQVPVAWADADIPLPSVASLAADKVKTFPCKPNTTTTTCKVAEYTDNRVNAPRVKLQFVAIEIPKAVAGFLVKPGPTVGADQFLAYQTIAEGAIVGISGGFFKDSHPIGLHVSNKKSFSNLADLGGKKEGGVLAMTSAGITLDTRNQVTDSRVKDYSEAVQGTPILLLNGEVAVKAARGNANRVAVGLDSAGNAHIFGMFADYDAVSLFEFARSIEEFAKKRKILGLTVLNLEGARQSHIYLPRSPLMNGGKQHFGVPHLNDVASFVVFGG